MKKLLTFFSAALVLTFLLWAGGDGNGTQAGIPEQAGMAADQDLKVTPDFGKIPLYFIPNQGQVHEQALYYTKAKGYTLWLNQEGMVFDSVRAAEKAETYGKQKDIPQYERDVSRMFFIGANKDVELAAVEEAKYKVHYFIGDDESQWKTNIPTSEAVVYQEIYKDIDLRVYGIEKQIEYDWVVKPGADVADIQMRYQGVKGTRIDDDGNLVIATKFGELMHRQPVSYQDIEGKRVAVDVAFKQVGENIYGFEPAEYNKNYILTIDPAVLTYSTFLGGNGTDSCTGVAVDSSGYAYVTGGTYSTDFPLESEIDDTAGALSTGFVTKFSVDGSSLEFSTYLGNSNYTACSDIKLSFNAGVVVTGSVIGLGFPTTAGAYQSSWGGSYDGFLTCLSLSGSSIVYSTYFGGSNVDLAQDLSKVETYLVGIYPGPYLTYDRVCMTGYTKSSNFPLLNARDSSLGGTTDAFVAKWTIGFLASVNLAYSTFLGGAEDDFGYGIDQDDGLAYVTGTTFSPYFPQVKNIDNTMNGTTDAFVTKFSSDGSTLEYSTFLGGSSHEDGFDIAVDSNGVAYVTGRTTSSDFPTSNAYDDTYGYGGEDAFMTQVDWILTGSPPSLWAGFPYSTYLGGSHYDRGHGIALDSAGDIYVTGRTQSTNFPMVSPYDSVKSGTGDAFISRFHIWTSLGLLFSTYLGGGSDETGQAITIDNNRAMYVVGSTESTNFPTENPFQGTKSTGQDGFVTKMDFMVTKNDFNSDDQPDIVWRNYASGGNVLWYLDYTVTSPGLSRGNIAAMSMIQGPQAAQVYQNVWEAGKVLFKDERAYKDVLGIAVPHEQKVEKVCWDASEAGKVFTRPVEGKIVGNMQELMKLEDPEAHVQAISLIGAVYLTTITDVNWAIGGTGDFNRDGNVDILWRHYSTGQNALWYMNGSTVIGTAYLTTITDTNWTMEGTGDFNGDGNVDILWRHYVSGQNVVWYMNGSTISGTATLTAVTDTNWKIGGIGDFNGDGNQDILWRNLVSGANVMWYMTGTTVSSTTYLITITDVNWRIEGAGDFNGDGNQDILWRHYSTGQNVLWYMNGSTLIASEYLISVADVNWRIENH